MFIYRFIIYKRVKFNVMFLALFILTTICLNAHADLLLGPSDTEAVIGTDITLRCSLATQQSSVCSVEWTHKRRSRDMFHVIYTSCYMIGDYETRYSVIGNPNQGEYNLMIRNVSLEDFGTYTCRDNTDGSDRKAQLIVFDSYPSSKFCSIEAPPDGPIGNNTCGIEQDEVRLSCNMSFSGNVVPTMEWTQVDGHVITSNISVAHHSNKVTVSSLVLNAAQIRNTTYICRIKYIGLNLESSISWSTTIRISQAYNMKNRTEVISVKSSTQKFDCAKAGDAGNCSYSWKHGGEKLTANGSLLTLTDDSNGIYTCSVICNIRGRSCSSAPMTLHVSSVQQSALTNELMITIPVVILALLFGGVLIFVFLIGKKKCFRYTEVPNETERIDGCFTSIVKSNKYNNDLHLPMPSSTVGA